MLRPLARVSLLVAAKTIERAVRNPSGSCHICGRRPFFGDPNSAVIWCRCPLVASYLVQRANELAGRRIASRSRRVVR